MFRVPIAHLPWELLLRAAWPAPLMPPSFTCVPSPTCPPAALLRWALEGADAVTVLARQLGLPISAQRLAEDALSLQYAQVRSPQCVCVGSDLGLLYQRGPRPLQTAK